MDRYSSDFRESAAEVFMPEGWADMTWEERVAAFLKSEDTVHRFDWPFPMAVFGTLRQNQHNNHLMHRAKIEKIDPAFLPNFFCRGLGVYFREGACAPFEIFHYKPEEWVKMLRRVDALESFYPDSDWSDRMSAGGGYYRTLAWLRKLPEGYVGEYFKPKYELWGERDMQLAAEAWEQYEKVPCWVYSSTGENANSGKLANSHVVYPVPIETETRRRYW